MNRPKLDPESPSLRPHGDVLQVPGGDKPDNGRPPGKHETDLPPTPGDPLPYPENPDIPGNPTEPGEPGQGQPIPPELDTTKPRL